MVVIMDNPDHYFALDIPEKLSDDMKQALKKISNLMYVLEEDGIGLIPLSDDLEPLMDEPLIDISEEAIARQKLKNLPNMYYPACSKDTPIEIKTAYFLAKNLANKGIIPWNIPVALYDPDKNLAGYLNLAIGR
jgi:hypothetical protein